MTVQGNVFKDMADAIRSKTGGTQPMTISQMATEISSIEVSDVSTIQVTLSDQKQNVLVTATATGGQGYSALSDSTGVATITVQPGYYYIVTAKKYTDSTQIHVDVGTYAVTLELQPVVNYGFAQVDIQIATSDPQARCSYPETITVNNETVENCCYGFVPQSSATDSFDMGDWDGHKILEGIKPVSFDGTNWVDLDTDASTWTDTTNDIFTEFPFQWLSITNDGTKIRIIFSDEDERPDSTFQCYAHAKQCDSYSNSDIITAQQSASRDQILESNNNSYFANQFHIGCFGQSGGASGQQIYSKKDATYATNIRYTYYFQGANARGGEYDCMSFQQYTYLQQLFVLIYKSTDSQTQHSQGLGVVSSESLSTILTNAQLQTTEYGMAGTVGTAQRNAFFWIHDLWGNVAQFIGGAWNRKQSGTGQSYRKVYYWLPRQSNSRAFNNGWTQATTYATQASLGDDSGLVYTGTSGGFIQSVAGTNLAGFQPQVVTGSSSTYFPDFGYVGAYTSYATFPVVGGVATHSAGLVGMFYCSVDTSSTLSNSSYGSRLSYRGGRT